MLGYMHIYIFLLTDKPSFSYLNEQINNFNTGTGSDDTGKMFSCTGTGSDDTVIMFSCIMV